MVYHALRQMLKEAMVSAACVYAILLFHGQTSVLVFPMSEFRVSCCSWMLFLWMLAHEDVSSYLCRVCLFLIRVRGSRCGRLISRLRPWWLILKNEVARDLVMLLCCYLRLRLWWMSVRFF